MTPRPSSRSLATATLALSLAVVGLVAGGLAPAPSGGSKIKGDPYPLDTCAVAGTKLDGDAVVFDFKGRELRFCCQKCLGKFKAEPEGYIAKVDEKIVKQQLPYYPMTTCLVTTEETLQGEDATPINAVVNNRLVRFCCKGCIRKFKKDPDRYLKTLDEAVIARQGKDYPVEMCLVSQEVLGADPTDVVVANRLVRTCCKGCIRALRKNPAKYLAKLEAERSMQEAKKSGS
jgi:YHS domain-containing protein